MGNILNSIMNAVKIPAALLTTIFLLSSFDANAHDSSRPACGGRPTCGEGVHHRIHHKPYKAIYKALTRDDNIAELTLLVDALQASSSTADYDALLQKCYDIVNAFNGAVVLTPVTEPDTGNALKVVSPRILVCESDGTVIVDTAAWTGAGPFFRKSTLTNWQNKGVNENHNSRIAIIDAQLWKCGQGAESKYSSSVKVIQNYVAQRLGGGFLSSSGTARLSKNAS